MFAVVIKDLKLHLNNKCFPVRNDAIQFKTLTQKIEKGKLFDLFIFCF